MEITFLTGSLSLLFLILICCGVYFLSNRIKIPYTVLLVLVGILLIPISKIELFNFIDDFRLTPDILFYVFLPILLFESAYNINYKQLIKNWKSITALAVFGLVISTFIIATSMFYLLPILGFNIPFLVCLLFGSLISATDPVAVLSLFKSIGAPRRLTLIFEGESLFNDGTSLALFLVILGIIYEGSIDTSVIFGGIGSFLSMLIGGILFGIFTGVVFSKTIGLIRNNKEIEIIFTLVLAHLTFILSEIITHHLHIPISGVISTTLAGVIIGNYGRYKITPKVEEYMENFWGFFGFLSNSLVFILMGLTLSYINIDYSLFIIPIIFVIIIVMIARAISVYIPIGFINIFKIEEKIPNNWQHLLSWGSLRGALALMMVLMIPGDGDKHYDKIMKFQETVGWNYDFSIKDFIMVVTIGSIMFTLLIKATTISYFMRKMKINELHDLEKFEHEEFKIISYFKILEKINKSFNKEYINKQEFEKLKENYELKLKNTISDLDKLLNINNLESKNLVKKAISLHSLGIEKQYLKELFLYNEIDEKNFKYILRKINRQIERIEQGNEQLSKIKDLGQKDYNFFEKLIMSTEKNLHNKFNIYIRSRAKVIITRKVIKELNKMKEYKFSFGDEIFDEIIKLYDTFNKKAEATKKEIYNKNKEPIQKLESKLFSKNLLKIEENVVEDLFQKEIITQKLHFKFIEEIESSMYEKII